jgi:hypothetical protein
MSGVSTPSRRLSSTTTRVAPPSRRNAFSCNCSAPVRASGLSCQEANSFSAISERHHEQSCSPVLARLRIAHHGSRAVINLGLFAGCGLNDHARFRRGRSAQIPHEALCLTVSPTARRPHRDTGSFQIRRGSFAPNSAGWLNAPQRPSEPAQRDDLLFLFFGQDIHPRRVTLRHVNVLDQLSRWPLFRCPRMAGFGCPPRLHGSSGSRSKELRARSTARKRRSERREAASSRFLFNSTR